MNANEALNKLCKWRSVLVGWMIGTKSGNEPGVKGYRDLIDRTLVSKVEIDCIIQLMIRKGIMTEQELNEQLVESALAYDKMFERKFPGYRTTQDGVHITPQVAAETNRIMGFPS